MSYQPPVLIKPVLFFLTPPRSGSTWLSELLSINGLANLFENLFFTRVNHYPNLKVNQPPIDILAEFFENMIAHKYHTELSQSSPLLYGSKLTAEDINLLKAYGGIEELVKAPTIHYIVLWREDMFAQAYSLAQLFKTGKWYSAREPKGIVDLSLEEFNFSLNFILQQYSDILTFLQEKKINFLCFQYERFFGNEAKIIRKIFDHCNVLAPTKITCTVPVEKNQYQNENSIRSLIKKSIFLNPEQQLRAHSLADEFRKLSIDLTNE